MRAAFLSTMQYCLQRAACQSVCSQDRAHKTIFSLDPALWHIKT